MPEGDRGRLAIDRLAIDEEAPTGSAERDLPSSGELDRRGHSSTNSGRKRSLASFFIVALWPFFTKAWGRIHLPCAADASTSSLPPATRKARSTWAAEGWAVKS